MWRCFNLFPLIWQNFNNKKTFDFLFIWLLAVDLGNGGQVWLVAPSYWAQCRCCLQDIKSKSAHWFLDQKKHLDLGNRLTELLSEGKMSCPSSGFLNVWLCYIFLSFIAFWIHVGWDYWSDKFYFRLTSQQCSGSRRCHWGHTDVKVYLVTPWFYLYVG